MKNKSTLKRLMAFCRPYSIYLIGALLFSTINIIFTLLTPILIGKAIDQMIGYHQVFFQGLSQKIFYIAFSVLMTAIFNYFLVKASNKMTYEITRDLRTELFKQYQVLPLSYIDSHTHGDMMSRMIADIDQISDGLLQGFTNLFGGIATILGTIGFMLYVNVKLALIVIVLTPLSLIVATLIAKYTFKFFQEQLSIRGEMSGFVEEMVGNQKVVKAFQHEAINEEKFDEINDRLFKSGVKSQFLGALANPSTRFVNAIVYDTVCIYGAFSVIGGGITVGGLSSFLTYANQYTKPFNDISNVFTELETALACAERVFKIIDEPAIKNPEHPETIDHPQGHIDLTNVNFSYTPERPLITDFNLHVNAGETIAIVGPTGCGKTTLINLLMRFYDPQSGTISIDGINTQKMDRSYLRSLYGMVLQDTWLFKGTIRDNIAYGSTHATDEQIIEAAKKAHAHKFIIQLKGGYDAMLAEEGSNLSQGQRQLLSIARIMLANPPMLILDEATSSIDTRTERQIQDAFDTMMIGRTTFIVAHRLSTIQKADQIIVMNDGHIIEQGKHEELLKKNGFYHNLYYSQFEKPE
ncbi:ABC transporter ATP-binding protein [uncultured Catenibacterium sp.]|uniref:ABC transporter ATP-binding protein n=1 Tax=uncultured Catenibacterium sp. TaxID=286142 RepID=UPI0025CCCE34|nr:ABC transporter ATP-binding protein [uncultured Catenibacterium sp.]